MTLTRATFSTFLPPQIKPNKPTRTGVFHNRDQTGPKWATNDTIHPMPAASQDDPDPTVPERPREELLDELRQIPIGRDHAATLIHALKCQHGMSIREIAADTGIPRTTAQRWAKDAQDEQ